MKKKKWETKASEKGNGIGLQERIVILFHKKLRTSSKRLHI